MSDALRQAVQRLAIARSATESAKLVLDTKLADFKLANGPLYAALDMAKQAEAQADAEVRALAMAAHKASGDKAPIGGVTIKFFTRLRYDAARALQWAKDRAMCLVPEQLDVKAFEKVAQATSIDFVAIEHEPQVTIAKDLSAYIPAEEPILDDGNLTTGRFQPDEHDPSAPEAAMDPAPARRRRGARATTRTVTPIETAPASPFDALPWEQ